MQFRFVFRRNCKKLLTDKISADKFCSIVKELSKDFNRPRLDDGTIFELVNFMELETIVDSYLVDRDDKQLKLEIELYLKNEILWL